MPGKHTKVSPHQDRAIVGLLRERSTAAAADYAGVNERTLRRWMAEDEGFIEAYREARRRALEHAIARLERASAKAADALEGNLDCGKPSVVARSAVAILTLAMRGHEMTDVERRLEELEGMVNADDGEQA